MAIASVGTFLSAQSKLEESTSSFATSADLAAGHVGIIIIAIDNITTTDVESTDISLVDLGGNEVIKFGEITNGNGAAGAGATCWVGVVKAYSTIPAGSYLSMQFSAPVTAKAVSGWAFSVGSGMTLSARDNVNDWVGWYEDANYISSWALSGLENIEHLNCRMFACESASSYTKTAAYTAFTAIATTGTPADTNVMACGEWEIKTGTTSSASNPSCNVAVDSAQWFIAFQEVGVPGDSSKTVTDSVPISEIVTKAVTPLVRSVSDSVSGSDSVLIFDASKVIKSLTDSIVCSENVTSFMPILARSLSDIVTGHDSKTLNDGTSNGTITLGGVNYEINDHPRIWLTPAREAALSGKRTPAGGYTNGAWARVSQRATAAIAVGYTWNVYTTIPDMCNCAIYWKATGNTTARDWAIAALTDIPNNYEVTPICYMNGSTPTYGTDNADYGSISEQYFAFAYSILHDVLSESQRQAFRDWMFGPFQACVWSHMYSNRGDYAPDPAGFYEDPGFNLTITKCFGELIWGLACCDEDSRGAEYVTYQYGYYVNSIRDNFLASLRGGHTYSGTQYGQQRIIPYFVHMMEALENTLQGFTGYETIAGDILKYFLHHALPDIWMIHSEWQNGGANYSNGRAMVAHAPLIEKYMNDSTYGNDAKYLHKFFRDHLKPSITSGSAGYLDYQFPAEIFTIWDPDAATLDYSTTNLAYAVENASEWDGTGTFFSRDAWSDLVSNQDAVWCHFNCGAFWGDHQNLTTGSYKIFRDEDYIVMENYMNYAAQSAANANVIYVGSSSVKYNGTQAMMKNAVTNQPTFSYAMGVMDGAFVNPVNYARRRFCHLRPINGSNTYIAILDTVSSTTSQTKSLYIHVPIAPSVSGDDVTVTRTNSRGIFRKILPVAGTVSASSAGNNTTGTTIPGESTDNPYRIVVSAAAGIAETLLHIWAVGDTSITMPTTTALSSTTPSGSLIGVLIDDQDMSRAFLGSNTNATVSATNIVIPVSYTSPNGCELIVADLTPSTGYSVSYAGSTFTLTVDAGSPYTVDSKGVFNYLLTGAQSDIVRNLVDHVSVSESVSTFTDSKTKSVVDNIGIVDSVSKLLNLGSSVQSNIVVSENVSKIITFVDKSLLDSIIISDSLSPIVFTAGSLVRILSDTVVMWDTRQVSVGSPFTPNNLIDDVSVIDTITKNLHLRASLSENILVSETFLRDLSLRRSLQDTVRVSTPILKNLDKLYRSIKNETYYVRDNTVRDLYSFISNYFISSTDRVRARDTVSKLLSVGISLSDSINTSDSVYKGFKTLTKALSDTINVSDNKTTYLRLFKSLVDNIPISELKTIELNLGRSAFSRIKVSDRSYRSAPLLQNLSDNLLVADSQNINDTIITWLNLSDNIIITDAVEKRQDLGLDLDDHEHLVLEFIASMDPYYGEGESSLFALNGNPDKFGYGITLSWLNRTSFLIRYCLDGDETTNYRLDNIPSIADGLPHKIRVAFDRRSITGACYIYLDQNLLYSFSIADSVASHLFVKGIRIGGHYSGEADKGWQGTIYEVRISKSKNPGILYNDSFAANTPYQWHTTTIATAKAPIVVSSGWSHPATEFTAQEFDVNDDDREIIESKSASLSDIVVSTDSVTLDLPDAPVSVTNVVATVISAAQIDVSWTNAEIRPYQIEIWRTEAD